MRLWTTRAVVAKTMKLSNSSKLVSLITEQHGLVKAVARGARRPKSAFGAALEPVTLITCMIHHRENRDLQNLSSADIIDPYEELKGDLTTLSVASAMVEIALGQTAEEDPKAATFALVIEGLDELRAAGGRRPEKILWRFALRLLATAGYRPSLDACVKCGTAPHGGPVFLSFSEGGVVCECTGTDDRFGIRVSPGALMAMTRLMADDTAALRHLKIAPAQQHEIEAVVLKFLAWHSGSSRPPRALAFLRKLRAGVGEV